MRRSPRFANCDYRTPGAYFVTAATHFRAPLFGALNDRGGVDLNDAGQMVIRWWDEVPKKFPTTDLDASVVMPDHFHAIVLLNCDVTSSLVSLSDVMQWFKTMTTNEYFRRVHADGWQAVSGKVWQRSFYDHVIRNEGELEAIRTYIESNPGALWERFEGAGT